MIRIVSEIVTGQHIHGRHCFEIASQEYTDDQNIKKYDIAKTLLVDNEPLSSKDIINMLLKCINLLMKSLNMDVSNDNNRQIILELLFKEKDKEVK